MLANPRWLLLEAFPFPSPVRSIQPILCSLVITHRLHQFSSTILHEYQSPSFPYPTAHTQGKDLHAPHAGLMSAKRQKRPSQTNLEQKSSVHTGSNPLIFRLHLILFACSLCMLSAFNLFYKHLFLSLSLFRSFLQSPIPFSLSFDLFYNHLFFSPSLSIFSCMVFFEVLLL